MRIAVPFDNGQVFQHFGHSENFKFYDIEDGKVALSQEVGTNGAGHGAIVGFLKENGVDVLICGGIGAGAQTALAESGIRLCGGVGGAADDAVKSYLDGTLASSDAPTCDHHHGEGHHCGGGENHHCGGGCGHNHE